MDATRARVVVTAGIIPGQPDAKHTRSWSISSTEWEESDEEHRIELLAEMNGKAQGYAGLLMLQPNALNFVTTEWLWM